MLAMRQNADYADYFTENKTKKNGLPAWGARCIE